MVARVAAAVVGEFSSHPAGLPAVVATGDR